MSLLLLLLLPPMLISTAAASSSVVKTVPGFDGELPFQLETGYVGLGDADDVQLFYFFVKSQRTPKRDPLVIWLTGGPGCSALSAFLYENGPLQLSVLNYTGGVPPLFVNPYSWTQYLNIIYVDSPAGSGFSYSKTEQGYVMDDYKAAAEVYTFLRKWMMDHPDFLTNQFYVGGDSYSGIIVPMVVQEIYNGNNQGIYPFINLQGYVLGNPVTDDYIDHNARIIFANRVTLVPDELYEAAKKQCKGNYVYIDPSNAQCVSYVEAMKELFRDISVSHILEPVCKVISPKAMQQAGARGRRSLDEELTVDLDSLLQQVPAFWCRGYGYALAGLWANNEQVRQALGVRPGTKEYWKRCNESLSYTENVASSVCYHKNLTNTRLRALIYSGDHDMSVPSLATRTWIQSLNMTVSIPWRAWYVDAQVGGYMEIYTNNDFEMAFATVKGGGHTAPEYRPKEVFELLRRWFAYYPL